MNCPNCGGAISVTDEVCPYCGSANLLKEKQIVNRAEGRAKTAEKKARLMVPMIIVIALLVANIIAAAVSSGAYSAGNNARRAALSSQGDTIVTDFIGYLDSGDYLLANNYYESGDYYSVDAMRAYEMVTDALYDYSTIFFYIAPDQPTKYNADDLLDNTANIAGRLYDLYSLSEKSYYYANTDAPDKLAYVQAITDEAEAMVAAAYHLTEAEWTSLSGLKESDISTLLRTAYLRNETDGGAADELSEGDTETE